MNIKPNQSHKVILDNLHSSFRRASSESNHPFRFFTVSTVSTEDQIPEIRMVVLRRFTADWTLRFFTDYRSSKVVQVRHNPSASLLFWEDEKKVQVRIQATAQVHHANSITDEEWKTVESESRVSYTTKHAPGVEIPHPKEGHILADKHSDKHFSVIDLNPFSIKVLQLKRDGHLALQFTRKSAEDDWSGSWIVP